MCKVLCGLWVIAAVCSLYAVDPWLECYGAGDCTQLLLEAIQVHDMARAQMALDHGANLGRPIEGKYMIEHAVDNNFPEMVKLLIGYGVDWRINYEKLNPLMLALTRGYVDVVRALQPDQFEVEYAILDNGDYPLHQAARQGHEALVRVLIEEFGVSMKVTNHDGKTPEVVAYEAGHHKIALYLRGAQHGRSIRSALNAIFWISLPVAAFVGYKYVNFKRHQHAQ